jgi:hypothetical protein
MKPKLSLSEVVAISGLSTITILRAVSIAKGNRSSFGRAYMPGLKSSYNQGRQLQFNRSDVEGWLGSRTKVRATKWKHPKHQVKAGRKRCSTCLKTRAINEFYVVSATGYLVPQCKHCHRDVKNRAYRAMAAKKKASSPIPKSK